VKFSNNLLLLIIFYGMEISSGQTCTINTIPIDFGTIYDNTINTVATGEITITCPSPTAIQIKLDAGQHSGGHFNLRRMRSARGTTLQYNLYQNVGHTLVWGDNTDSTKIMKGMSSSYLIYGKIPANQSVSPGTYSDSVLIMVEY
jgi:spore coat protein U-like protein